MAVAETANTTATHTNRCGYRHHGCRCGCRGCGAPADARRHRAGDRAEEDEGGGGSEGEEEEEEEEREGDWLDVAPLGGRLVAFAAEQLDHEVTITRGNGITRQR